MKPRRVLFPHQMTDISLVDLEKAEERDPDALVEVVKAEDIAVATAAAEIETEKATFDAEARKKLAASGAAMDDGSFPIRNATDLHNAMQAIGRAKDPAAVKAHIKQRAAALGLTSELTPAFKAEDVEAELAALEAEKAGAEFSAKNRDILSRIKGVLGRLLGEESQEPEHADIKSELEQAETLLEGKKAAGSASTEEIEMTPEELTAALAAAVAPLAARLDAIEATKAAPVETPAPDAEAEKARVATEAEEIAKARAARPQAVPDAPRLTRHEDGAKELQEAAKSARHDVTKLPTLAEGLRYLTNRDVRTGALADR